MNDSHQQRLANLRDSLESHREATELLRETQREVRQQTYALTAAVCRMVCDSGLLTDAVRVNVRAVKRYLRQES